MTVVVFPVRIRLATFVMLLLGLMMAMPAVAQKLGPDGAPNPTASGTSERDLLKQVPRVEGRIDIPDTRAAVLIQPAGRTWDYFHEVLLHWGGAAIILGTIVMLGLAYLVMGPLRITAGRSGQKVLRFKAFERFSHWLTAVSFVILGLTGLNITFGKIALLPLVGPDTFSDISQAAKYVHNFTSFSFVAGLVLIIAIFFKDNLHRLGQAGRWLHQEQTCPCRSLQSR
jgi:formate dehydrogenase subunit gamma